MSVVSSKDYSMKALLYYGDSAKYTTTTVSLAAPTADMPAGTVLGQVTSTSLYVPYDSTASDGSQTAKGILGTDVPYGMPADTAIATMYTAGTFHSAALSGWDSTAATAVPSIHVL